MDLQVFPPMVCVGLADALTQSRMHGDGTLKGSEFSKGSEFTNVFPRHLKPDGCGLIADSRILAMFGPARAYISLLAWGGFRDERSGAFSILGSILDAIPTSPPRSRR